MRFDKCAFNFGIYERYLALSMIIYRKQSVHTEDQSKTQ